MENELGDGADQDKLARVARLAAFNERLKILKSMASVFRVGMPVAGALLLMCGIAVLIAGGADDPSGWIFIAASPFSFVLYPLFVGPTVARVEAQLAREGRIERLEERSIQEPAQSKLAWDLARSKLESYLDRNLSQVNMIFMLTVAVMACGMGLIGVGVVRAIQDPNATTPAVLSAVAGILVQFVAGTFLIIYRSTMEQARDYVVVLERINAVGMSINILEGIEGDADDQKMRNAARGELARDLLRMYGVSGLKKRARTASEGPKLRSRRSASKIVATS